MYFFIYCSEDGDVSVQQYEKADIERCITEKDYGDIGYFEKLEESDPQYWDDKALIIKGEIVTPKPVRTVEKFEI